MGRRCAAKPPKSQFLNNKFYRMIEDNLQIFQYKTNLKKRFVASLIDYIIVFAFTFFYIDYFGTPNEEGGKTVNGLMALPVFGIWFFYFVVVEECFQPQLVLR